MTDIRFYVGASDVVWSTATTKQIYGRHYYCGTYDGTTATLYVDGVQRAQGTLTYSAGSDIFSVPGYSGGSHVQPGVFSDVAIYSACLSGATVLAHYNKGK